MCLHDLIVDELIKNKSLAALIYLIDKGRELELTINSQDYFISRDKAQKYVSLWEGKNEQSFESTERLIENAIILNDSFLHYWNSVQIKALF